jgi:hypothetical protein
MPDFADAVVVLKREITELISASVRRFTGQTGVSPSGIGVEMVEVTSVADNLRRYVVGEVTIHIGDL